MSDTRCKEVATSPTGWQDVGQRDGRNGYSPGSRLAGYRESCEDVKILPDEKNYMVGWKRGILNYCTIKNAYDAGVEGSGFNLSDCQGFGDDNELLRANFRLGKDIHDHVARVRDIEREIDELEKQLNDKTHRSDEPVESRVKRYRDMRIRIGVLYDELAHLRPELADLKARPMITRK